MLLPALSKARGKARSISCASNLKTIGLAGTLYIHDNLDWIVPGMMKEFSAAYNWDESALWFGNLAGLGDKANMGVNYDRKNRNANSVFKCPSAPTKLGGNYPAEHKFTHYNVNIGISGITLGGKGSMQQNAARTVNAITSPSIAIWAGDGIMRDNVGGIWSHVFAFRHGEPDSRQGSTYKDEVPYHLKGRANVVHMDGHVSAYTLRELMVYGLYGRLNSADPSKSGYDIQNGTLF